MPYSAFPLALFSEMALPVLDSTRMPELLLFVCVAIDYVATGSAEVYADVVISWRVARDGVAGAE